jgi:sigma-B regulation protein RsbU (phosphoserine phosphatase)
MSDTPYQMQTTVLEHGSSVLFYTDGLNEAMDAADNLFGKERIYKEIQRAIEHDQTAPKELINNMIEAVHNYVGKTEQSDDLTMLSIRFK